MRDPAARRARFRPGALVAAATTIVAALALFPGTALAAQASASSKPAAKHAASSKPTARPEQARRRSHARHRTAASHAKPEPVAVAAPLAPPPAPPAPNWPANEPAKPAKVTWDSHGLTVEASNSSLDQILHEAAVDMGAKVQGLSLDQRVFGTYGPGPARDVLTQLLDGSGYNVLMIGDQGNGTPREIVLSTSGPANPPAQPANTVRTTSEENDDEAVQTEPQSESQHIEPNRSPFGNGGPVRTPQQVYEQMQQRQQEIEQQREEQQNNNPQ